MKLTPGVWKATVRGVPDQVVMVTDATYAHRNITLTCPERGEHTHKNEHITDPRPLILLDLDDPRRLQRLVRDAGLIGLADQIEAQTKPARIEEPKGAFGVVTAAYSDWPRCRWTYSDGLWHSLRFGANARVIWDALIDPTLIRAGLS